MKFVTFISHVIPHTLDYVYEPCEKFNNFHLTNERC
jgi:hypothetical protein